MFDLKKGTICINMQKTKQLKPKKRQKTSPQSCLEFIDDDRLRLAIPIGPHFQADIPDWTGPPQQKCSNNSESESNDSRWLGTRIWPSKGRRSNAKCHVVGKGRPDFCQCLTPGSVECKKCHIIDKRVELQLDLGPAFWTWRFDVMGEYASKSWSLKDEKKFESIVKMNPMSQGKSFLKPALEGLPSKCREMIVNYYFGVYVPQRISLRTRSGYEIVDTDDEEETGEADRHTKSSRKRYQADCISSSSKHMKSRYLTGRR